VDASSRARPVSAGVDASGAESGSPPLDQADQIADPPVGEA
jgi:hypothetical protein